MEEENTPTKTFIRVAVPENTCLQCGKLIDNPALRRKLFSGKQKTKTCQSLELLLGDVFPRDNDLGTICRNCSERNETLTKKIFQVRANFSGPKGSLANNLQSSVGVKRLTKAERAEVPEQGAIGGRTSTKRRALFTSSCRVLPHQTRKLNQANDFEKVYNALCNLPSELCHEARTCTSICIISYPVLSNEFVPNF